LTGKHLLCPQTPLCWQQDCCKMVQDFCIKTGERFMFRLIRTLLVLVVVLCVVYFAYGWWVASPGFHAAGNRPSIGQGSATLDTARERGAELGAKAAVATAKMQETLTEAGITAKIKAKMALDDNVKARAIDVTTSGSTVTLTGKVRSDDERERAVKMTRETNGVTRVIDRLDVQR
jgi:hypothetical protein